MDQSTQTEQSSIAYITVFPEDGKSDSAATELPLEKDNTLTMATLHLVSVGAVGLKYKNETSGLMRILKPEGDRIQPPLEGWGTAVKYIAFLQVPNLKRPAVAPATGQTAAKVMKPNVLATGTASGVKTMTPTRHTISATPKPGVNNSTVSKVTPKKKFSCDLCNMVFTMETQMRGHLENKRHKDAVKRRQMSAAAHQQGALYRAAGMTMAPPGRMMRPSFSSPMMRSGPGANVRPMVFPRGGRPVYQGMPIRGVAPVGRVVMMPFRRPPVANQYAAVSKWTSYSDLYEYNGSAYQC